MNPLRKRFSFALGLFSVYLLSIVAIKLAAPDLEMSQNDFPEGCPSESLNCSFIGPDPHRSGGLKELRFNSSLAIVMGVVNEWVDSQPRTETVNEGPNQTHSVFRSFMFRFPDDFVVKGHCDDGDAVIHVYSKSRLGISDIGVNKNRVNSFAKHMVQYEMPTSDCFMQ